jgi:hypothetical protein
MKFNHLISESLHKTDLKKIRIKVDPANINVTEDLAKCDGYEGYVLAEDSDCTKIMLITPDSTGNMSVIEVPNNCIQQINQRPGIEQLSNFKQFIILTLNLSESDPLIQQLLTCTTIDDIESFLKDSGLTEDDITKLYKYYIINEQ